MPSTRPVARRWGLWAVLAVVLSWAPAVAQAQSLASIPVQVVAPGEVSPEAVAASGLRARVHVADVPGLARLLGLPDAQGAAAPHLDVTLVPAAHGDVATPVDPAQASFIVDFQEPAVVRLSQQLAAEAAPVDGARIVAFVARSMHADSASNAYLASHVAQALRGDCTEYALLTAALARAAHIPARLVQGTALVHADGHWQAYGHAWVQMQEGGRWVVRDSALAAWPGPVFYLPTFVVANEGPGYKLDLLRSLGRWPSHIEILGPADTEAPR